MRDESGPFKIRSAGVSWRKIDGSVIALDLESSTYVTTNETGTLLWPRLAAGASFVELVGALVEHYELDTATAEADVRRFVTMLAEAGLLDTQ